MSTGGRQTRGAVTTTLYIKNMVCNRCIKVVREEFERLGCDVRGVTLGEAVIAVKEHPLDTKLIRAVLEGNGFELIEDRRVKTIEKIKHAALKFVQTDQEKNPIAVPASRFIEREVGQDYHALSTLFSSMESVTIEQYIILQKIERVKELLKYGELTLSEISYRLGYSSLQHLSNQFKNVTGMAPSRFKKIVENTRLPLDRVAAPTNK